MNLFKFNKNIESIYSDDLVGFRPPLNWECEEIKKIIIKDLRANIIKIEVGYIFLFVISLCLFLSLIFNVGNSTFFEKVVLFILTIISSIFIKLMKERLIINKDWLKKMKKNEFLVMDCYGYEADPSADVVGGGTIKVYNDKGQYCQQNYFIDRDSLIAYMNGKENQFLLMKCISNLGKYGNFYELFSLKKLRMSANVKDEDDIKKV